MIACYASLYPASQYPSQLLPKLVSIPRFPASTQANIYPIRVYHALRYPSRNRGVHNEAGTQLQLLPKRVPNQLVPNLVLTPAECTIHFGIPVVPDEYIMKSGWLKGSCSKINSGTVPSSDAASSSPDLRNDSRRHLLITIQNNKLVP